MKKLLMSGIAAFAALHLAAEFAVPPSAWQITKDAANPSVTENAFSATANGNDTILTIKGFQPFEAGQDDLLLFSMRLDAGKKTFFQLFWANKEQPNFSEEKSINVPLTGTGELETYCISLTGRKGWAGTITALRIDPVAIPKGTTEPFSIGEFKFTSSTAGIPIPARNWTAAVNFKRVSNIGAVYTGEFEGKNDPYMLAAAPFKIDASKLKTVEFELKLPAGSSPAGQLFWQREGEKTYSEPNSVRYNVPVDGEFHKVTIDLSKKAEWKDSVVQLRLDMVNNPPKTGEFQMRNFIVK